MPQYTPYSALGKNAEKDCFGITPDRKYYHVGDTFIKRNLRQREWIITTDGRIHVPRLAREKLLNEAAAMEYVAKNTDIPVPKLHCVFEDDEAVYLVTEYVDGISWRDLDDTQKAAVMPELKAYVDTLHKLRSKTIGGVSGFVIPTYSTLMKTPRDFWELRSSATEEYVFCHMDLNYGNFIIDPTTFKVKAIIDWEYSGFYPERFDQLRLHVIGSPAQLAEPDLSQELLDFLESMRK